MQNFDFKNLYLIRPCKLGDEAYARAMHAYKTLDDAKIFDNFTESTKNLDFIVGTSSIESQNDKRHLRNAENLEVFSQKIIDVDGKIGIVFGREDIGLLNEELSKCDMMVKIPTSEKYLSLNLSHSVALVLYSLYIKLKEYEKEKRVINQLEKEKLYDFFSQILDEINYPDHKRENTEIMFKRLMGRAVPSKWEYHTLMGVLSKSLEKMKK
jgi:TrmH family RNA methyltransferase